VSQTFADNLIPSATGYDLGSATARWDGYFQNMDISGTLSLAGAISGLGVVYPATYGAVGDGRAVTSAVATASNTTLVDTTASPWVAADVGKTIVLYGQTYSPGFVTTIASFTDSAHIVLTAAPTLSGSCNAVWGTDDSTAIANAAAAITARGNVSRLHFPQGIFLMATPLVFTNCQGLIISGEGAGSAASLGSYNLTAQRATGTELVWVGSAGGTTGAVNENVMLQVSGQFLLEDIAFCGSQLASHCVQVGGTAASSSFDWSVSRVNAGYAAQWGFVFGGTGADQGSNYGECQINSIMTGGNGVPNTAVAESSIVGGGDIFLRFGTGNFQLKFNTGFIGIGGVNGNHHVYGYSGHNVAFDNYYFAPLAAGVYSSVYVLAGNRWTFDNCYDENGYMLHDAAGDFYDFRQCAVRQQATTTPHFAMVIDGTPTMIFSGFYHSGLTMLCNAGAKITRNHVSLGPSGPFPAYGKTLDPTVGSLTRSGTTLTLTTTTAHAYRVGDYVALLGIADATWNGIFKVVTSTTPTLTVVNAAAAGATSEGGTIALAPGLVADTTANYVPQWSHPFINYLESSSGLGTLADALYGVATNLANKNAITMVPGNTAGAAGASFPATIPAGWHFLDMRGSQVTFLGGPYTFGTAANPATVSVSKLQIGGAAASNAMLQGDGTNFVAVTPTGTGTPVLATAPQFTGPIGIGTPANANTMIMAETTTSTTATQNGISSRPTYSSAATTAGVTFQSFPKTQAAAFTLASLYHYKIEAPTIGGGSTITTQYGFYCPALTGAGTNWAFYNAGAANNLLGTGTTTMGNSVYTVAAPTVAAAQVGFGSTTAATATNGGGEAMKANVDGYIIVNIAGTAKKIPYVAT